MSHYLADMAVFGHVMGDGTDWGTETHHSDYENYVNTRTSSYNAEFNVFLSFDGNLSLISAYNATILLAYDTTFDNGSLTCVWMDQNYDWDNSTFQNRAGASLNLAVNYVTDVLHTLYSACHGTVNDTTPPVANAGQSKEVAVGSAVTFDAGGSTDDIGITSYVWTFTDGTAKTLTGVTANYTFTNLGTYIITLNVTDTAGNWDTDTVTITIKDFTKPTANAGPDQTVNEDTLVYFDGSNSTDNIGITSYTWKFTDGILRTLTGMKQNYTFANPGIYVATLNVTDSAGNYNTGTVTITVKDATAPVADAGLNKTAQVNTEVSFDANGSSDNVGITSYEWNFGDGATATGATATYTYASPGTYTVTLTVRDAAGNTDTHQITVTVREALPTWMIAIGIASLSTAIVTLLLRRSR